MNTKTDNNNKENKEIKLHENANEPKEPGKPKSKDGKDKCSSLPKAPNKIGDNINTQKDKEKESLKEAYEKLQKDYESLQKDHESLKEAYTKLQKDNESLRKVNEKLQKDNESLRKEIETLKEEKENLIKMWTVMNNRLNWIEKYNEILQKKADKLDAILMIHPEYKSKTDEDDTAEIEKIKDQNSDNADKKKSEKK